MKKLLYVFMLGVTLQSIACHKYFAVAECVLRLKVPTPEVSASLFNFECIMKSEHTREAYRHVARLQQECGLTDAHKNKSILYPLSERTQLQITLTTNSLLTALYQHTKQRLHIDDLGIWTFDIRGPVKNSLTADFPTIGQLLEDDINCIRQYPEYFLWDMQRIMHDRMQQ